MEANARSPHDRLDLGMTRERSLEDRRPGRDGLWMLMREAMYLGEENFNARKVMRRTLYARRCSTDNQWRLLRTGVMCEYLCVFVTRRAAAFWTRWSF